MRKFTTVLLMFLSVLTFAQPTITENNIPQLGDSVVIAICSDQVNAGSSGAEQTWDFSTLNEIEEQYFKFLSPTEAPKKDSFPTANVVGRSWENSFSFYQTDGSALGVAGYVLPMELSDTTLQVFDDLQDLAQFPFTFNSTFTDTYSGTSHIAGVGAFPFDGTITFEADGYGTLILPNATYENVVRYHFVSTQQNYFNGIPAGTQTKEQWGWISEDYRFWLLLMEVNTVQGIANELVWYDKNPYPVVPTTTKDVNQDNLAIYPNPIRSGQDVNFHWESSESRIIEIYGMDGSFLSKEKIYLNHGTNAYSIPVSLPGIYVIKISSDLNTISQRILITQ